MFKLEKDMVSVIHQDLTKMFGDGYSEQEFISGKGRPDLVFARLLESKRCKAIPDYYAVYILVKYLNREGKILSIDRIMSQESLGKKKLHMLFELFIEDGFVEEVKCDYYIVKQVYKPLVNEFISIEAKLSDWRNGFYQAMKYSSFSNATYVAIAEENINKVDMVLLKKNGVGLISVSESGASFVFKAKKVKPKNKLSHSLLTEYFCEKNVFC